MWLIYGRREREGEKEKILTRSWKVVSEQKNCKWPFLNRTPWKGILSTEYLLKLFSENNTFQKSPLNRKLEKIFKSPLKYIYQIVFPFFKGILYRECLLTLRPAEDYFCNFDSHKTFFTEDLLDIFCPDIIFLMVSIQKRDFETCPSIEDLYYLCKQDSLTYLFRDPTISKTSCHEGHPVFFCILIIYRRSSIRIRTFKCLLSKVDSLRNFCSNTIF